MKISSICVKGLHGRFDFDHKFHDGINIVYGKNGASKTTLLHIIANLLNADFDRFAFLSFSTIEATFRDESWIKISKTKKGREQEMELKSSKLFDYPKKQKVLSIVEREYRAREDDFVSKKRHEMADVAYFPAFRTMIEAWSSLDSERNPRLRERFLIRSERTGSREQSSTLFARELFGNFVPAISFPSPREIQERLANDVEGAIISLATLDRQILNDFSFEVLRSMAEPQNNRTRTRASKLMLEIRSLSDRLADVPPIIEGISQAPTWDKLQSLVQRLSTGSTLTSKYSAVLAVYRDILKLRVNHQERVFEQIVAYLSAINDFLDGKQISLSVDEGRSRPKVYLRFQDGTRVSGLRALSSGERQILTLIFASSKMGKQDVVLIDEPELSLHVDWQRNLMPHMVKQLGNRQVVACTHSPVIASGYEDRMVELNLRPTGHFFEDEDEFLFGD